MSKIETIETHFRKIMEALGLDLSNPSLQKTPARVAKMYVEELFVGLEPDSFPKISLFPYDGEPGSIISFDAIRFSSMCEHHFLPMRGFAWIRYIPRKKILGLSKVHRIVRYFAARPQLQERMGQQIADSLSHHLETPDVSVQLKAKHECLATRGVQDATDVETLIQRGAFLQCDTN